MYPDTRGCIRYTLASSIRPNMSPDRGAPPVTRDYDVRVQSDRCSVCLSAKCNALTPVACVQCVCRFRGWGLSVFSQVISMYCNGYYQSSPPKTICDICEARGFPRTRLGCTQRTPKSSDGGACPEPEGLVEPEAAPLGIAPRQSIGTCRPPCYMCLLKGLKRNFVGDSAVRPNRRAPGAASKSDP